jgi:hypothetical protein
MLLWGSWHFNKHPRLKSAFTVNSTYLKTQSLKIYIIIIIIIIITGAVTINWLIKPINYFISDLWRHITKHCWFPQLGMENVAYNTAVLIETLCKDLSTAWL